MKPAVQTSGSWAEDYTRLESGLPGAQLPWLRQLRGRALERFMAMGLPGLNREDWKYTDVRPLAKRKFSTADEAATVPVTALESAVLTENAHWLVFLDGRFLPELSAVHALPQGVMVASLAGVLQSQPEAVEGQLDQYANGGDSGFAALNTAFMADGAFVRLPRGVQLEKPIELLFIASGAADTVAHVRNLVVAEPDSRAVLLEHYFSMAEASYLTNVVTELSVGDGAVIEHYKLQRESSRAYHMAGIHARQGRDSGYRSHNVALGGRLARTEIGVMLDGEGAECTLNGLYLGRGGQHLDQHTRIDHRHPGGTSREWYKGILDDHARGVFSGRIVVHEHAQRTDARQANDNLLLADGAEADSRPQLEIYADDVQCAHGSTVGQLDADALFYLRSRGMDAAHARSLLVYAFAADVVQRMQLAPLRTRLEHWLAGSLLADPALGMPA